MRLLRHVRDAKNTLIHCSAGVGRTGTVMAVEVCLRSLLEGRDISVSIQQLKPLQSLKQIFFQPLDILKDLRSQRAGMIQTEGQYLFVHRALIEYIHAKKVARAEATEFLNAYMLYAAKPPTSPAPIAAASPVPVANRPLVPVGSNRQVSVYQPKPNVNLPPVPNQQQPPNANHPPTLPKSQ